VAEYRAAVVPRLEPRRRNCARVALEEVRYADILSRLDDLPDEWRKDIEETRAELEGLSRRLVRAVADARIRLRLLGLGYVIVGLVLSWLGNLL
jgi:hypothetical protein